MQFTELLTKRYSCRDFQQKEISDADLLAIIESARLAPSACNKQPWKFYVVKNEAVRKAMLSKSRPAFMQAPVVIACVGFHDDAWHRPSDGKDHTDVDLSIAAEHICLAAANLGIGSCWVCSFDTQATRQALGLEEGQEPIALIPIGYPAKEEIPAKTRKPIDEIAIFI